VSIRQLIIRFVALVLLAAPAWAGQVRLTLGFESDPVGAPPLGATFSTTGCAFITNAPVFTGSQSLAVVSTGQVAHVDWGTFYPDVFAGWYQQLANLPLTVTFAARAAQTNATLDLFIGQYNQQTAARIQFTSQGQIVAVTAEGVKPVMPYAAGQWYRFTVGLRTAEPRWRMDIADAKGLPLATAANLAWADLALTNGVLFGFGFRALEGGTLFVDDFRVQEVEPTKPKPWPRELVTYPKESR
jgi:hypothetical protein